MTREQYLSFLHPYLQATTLSDARLIREIEYIGAIKFDAQLALRIANGEVDKPALNELAAKVNYDVSTDDLIGIYYVAGHKHEYYVIIKDPWELFDNGYLIKVLLIG